MVSRPFDSHALAPSGVVRSTVAARRLDGLVQVNRWDLISLSRIDMERSEHLILNGSPELLRRYLPLVFIEVCFVVYMLM